MNACSLSYYVLVLIYFDDLRLAIVDFLTTCFDKFSIIEPSVWSKQPSVTILYHKCLIYPKCFYVRIFTKYSHIVDKDGKRDNDTFVRYRQETFENITYA